SGNWRGTYTSAEAGGFIWMTLNQDGNRISGTFATSDEGGGTIEGRVNGDSFTFDVGLPAFCPGDISGDGDVNGGRMTLHFSGYDCETTYTNGYAELNRY
ncbi:MAG TPA: hypothetical protein PLI51_04075, partial [bacterium]|nr:hypothetical protein [bacterium]